MSLCERVLVGVDGSPAGLVALRQAIRLLAPDGTLLAATVYDPTIAVHSGYDASRVLEQLAGSAAEARDEAERELAGVPGGEARVLEGPPARRLLELARLEGATLAAVGSHGESRAAGILLGSVPTSLLHEARCAVLLARPKAEPDAFPRSILAGVDGSHESLAAFEAALELAERFDASLVALAATGGKPVDVDGLVSLRGAESELLATAGARARAGVAGPSQRVPLLEWTEEAPVDALVAASADADLLVLGSRGLHGLAALGSVSERVAHRAGCSVLVVRGTA